MNEQKLSTITLQTIENYRSAAEHAVQAYRVGGHRLVGLVNEQLNSRVYPRADKVVPAVSGQVYRLQNRAFELTGHGIDMISDNTDRLLTISANSAATGVHRIANGVAGIDSPYLSKGLDAAAKLNLPSARLALAISAKLSDGAQTLLSAASGPVSTRVEAGARKAVATTRRTVKTGARTAVKRATAANNTVVRKARVAAAQIDA